MRGGWVDALQWSAAPPAPSWALGGQGRSTECLADRGAVPAGAHAESSPGSETAEAEESFWGWGWVVVAIRKKDATAAVWAVEHKQGKPVSHRGQVSRADSSLNWGSWSQGRLAA